MLIILITVKNRTLAQHLFCRYAFCYHYKFFRDVNNIPLPLCIAAVPTIVCNVGHCSVVINNNNCCLDTIIIYSVY